MQQDYINLINFLKENDESVRKDLETLKFGTNISRCGSKYKMLNSGEFFDEKKRIFYLIDDRCFRGDKLNIIGNNLDYHHIMMYAEKKKEPISMWNNKIVFANSLIILDNTKYFHEQKNEVYKALLDYFIGLQ